MTRKLYFVYALNLVLLSLVIALCVRYGLFVKIIHHFNHIYDDGIIDVLATERYHSRTNIFESTLHESDDIVFLGDSLTEISG